jgi:hypothetical protein
VKENVKALVQFDDITNEITVTLKVRSERKKNLWAQRSCDISSPGLSRFTELVGGELAEHLGKKYGDNLDPSTVAKLGKGCILEALAKASGNCQRT